MVSTTSRNVESEWLDKERGVRADMVIENPRHGTPYIIRTFVHFGWVTVELKGGPPEDLDTFVERALPSYGGDEA